MDLNRHPDLLDRLAASHALGSLRGGARRRFESMARESPTVRTAAMLWQARIASLTELQVQQVPDPAVWQRIDRMVRAEQQGTLPTGAAAAGLPDPIDATPRWWERLGWWRGAATAGALATLLSVTAGWQRLEHSNAQVAKLQAQLRAVPQDAYVAVLHDDQSNATMLVTFDPRNSRLTLQRVGDYRESPDRSLQLWAIPPGGGPRSLGVLDRSPLLRLAAGEDDMRDASALAISLEPRGGVPGSGGPTGPVLFSGRLIQKLP
ncbi:anti-sigma factor [Comamonadaceae bacterium G21597-S1]|nr:anti-sigma factor [Comamonadaceae bacterium G21597-S1]